jgi:hypothetical protein
LFSPLLDHHTQWAFTRATQTDQFTFSITTSIHLSSFGYAFAMMGKTASICRSSTLEVARTISATDRILPKQLTVPGKSKINSENRVGPSLPIRSNCRPNCRPEWCCGFGANPRNSNTLEARNKSASWQRVAVRCEPVAPGYANSRIVGRSNLLHSHSSRASKSRAALGARGDLCVSWGVNQ